MKLTRKEKKKIELQMKHNDRGPTWVGLRPVVYVSDKHNLKKDRRNAGVHKHLCRKC